jgi:hypothetical protein
VKALEGWFSQGGHPVVFQAENSKTWHPIERGSLNCTYVVVIHLQMANILLMNDTKFNLLTESFENVADFRYWGTGVVFQNNILD